MIDSPKILTCEQLFAKAKEIEFGLIIQECTVQDGKITVNKITVQEVSKKRT